jgi:hypothetical protein
MLGRVHTLLRRTKKDGADGPTRRRSGHLLWCYVRLSPRYNNSLWSRGGGRAELVAAGDPASIVQVQIMPTYLPYVGKVCTG